MEISEAVGCFLVVVAVWFFVFSLFFVVVVFHKQGIFSPSYQLKMETVLLERAFIFL